MTNKVIGKYGWNYYDMTMTKKYRLPKKVTIRCTSQVEAVEIAKTTYKNYSVKITKVQSVSDYLKG